jgi:BolA protein
MTADIIKNKLTSTLNPKTIEVIDNSMAHAGHSGAQSGGGHFHVKIVSEQFDGKSMVQRHQLIYTALGDMMKKEIHALGIEAYAPTETTTRS